MIQSPSPQDLEDLAVQEDLEDLEDLVDQEDQEDLRIIRNRTYPKSRSSSWTTMTIPS